MHSGIELFGGGYLKYRLVMAGKAAGNAATSLEADPLGTLAGLAADGTEAFAKEVVLPISSGATGLQILAHAGCATVARQQTGQMDPLPPGVEVSF